MSYSVDNHFPDNDGHNFQTVAINNCFHFDQRNHLILSSERVLVAVAIILEKFFPCSLLEIDNKYLNSITVLEIYIVYMILDYEANTVSLALSSIKDYFVLSLGPLIKDFS